jgi:M6 family metalloprotease-like protein
MERVVMLRYARLIVLWSCLLGFAAHADVQTSVTGPQRLLVVAVRFPGTQPTFTLEQIEDKIHRVDRYLRSASYGKASLDARLAGWYDMPAALDEYRVSPHNAQVDPQRVRRLLADAIGAVRRDVDIESYDAVWIVVGVLTRPGEGYGMICYAANPGMLSRGSFRGGYSPRFETVALPGGGSFAKAATVSAENAVVGHVVHDLFHVLGGLRDGRRVIPDLYDFQLQNTVPPARMLPDVLAIHTGPWDIMSQHFIERALPPPAPSSFTRLRLGWIGPEQVVTVQPGESREVALAPLASGNGLLVVQIPVDGQRYILVENRQKLGGDAVMPATGMLVLEIDPTRHEGTAIARVADANPGTPKLYGAPFRPGAGERRYYENAAAGVAIVPLELQADGAMRILVTTPARLKAAMPLK